MAKNALHNLEQVLLTGANAVEVDPAIRVEAVKSIQRMLDFAASHNISGALPGR
jgi:quinolinate synthase